MAAIAVCFCLVLRICLKRENKRMEDAEESAATEEELVEARSKIRFVL
jgi:organic hydroperoxide reductase OsmC/OhrA